MTGLPRHQTTPHPWFEVLHSKEMEMLDPDVRRDPVRIAELLHDEFLEFGSTGQVYDTRAVIDLLKAEDRGKVVIRDFAVRQLAEDAALVIYRSVGESGQQARRSSIWVRANEEWKMVFHQGTRINRRHH